jgi:hypothetical protein
VAEPAVVAVSRGAVPSAGSKLPPPSPTSDHASVPSPPSTDAVTVSEASFPITTGAETMSASNPTTVTARTAEVCAVSLP